MTKEQLEKKLTKARKRIVELETLEKEKNESRDFLQNVYMTIGDGVLVTDPEGYIVNANSTVTEMLGYSEDELQGKHIIELSPPGYTPAPMLEELLTKGQIKNYESQWLNIDGAVFPIEVNITLLKDNKANMTGAVASVRDITRRRQAEKETRAAKIFLENIIKTSVDGIIVTDPTGAITMINDAISELTGYSADELLGMHSVELSPNREADTQTDKKLIEKLFKNGVVDNYEHIWRRKDGSAVSIEMNMALIKDQEGAIAAAVSIVRDISSRKKALKEKKKLEDQLMRAEKMEAIGTLSGGVAHDLNNILGAIVGYPDLMLDDIPGDSPLRSSILAIKESGERAVSVIQDLLTMTRRGIAISKVQNLNNIITEHLATPEFHNLKESHPDISFESNLSNGLLNILGSSVHLKKVVMNLVLNAAEAMPAGGKIIVSTENTYLDKPVKGYDRIEEGDYTLLTVSDEGIGISGEDLKRIFEPFYTKKVMGRSGTGLGMAVVWGTIKDHKGYIDIESHEGTGTTFKLFFPVTRDEMEAKDRPVSVEEYVGNGEKILIIDDIKAQRELATNMLTKLNYNTETAESGEEAVEYLQNDSADILVLDMIMDPGIDGLETYKRILEIHPKQKAVIASGFSETDRVREAQQLGACTYIKKPYTLEKIGLAIKTELKNTSI